MNGYKYTRIEDEGIEAELALAVGLDKEVPGAVIVDLVLPKFKGGFRFSARQFDMFTYYVVGAAKMAMTFAMIMDCVSDSLVEEDDEVIHRVMDKVGQYMSNYAMNVGGEEPNENPQEEIPFDEL